MVPVDLKAISPPQHSQQNTEKKHFLAYRTFWYSVRMYYISITKCYSLKESQEHHQTKRTRRKSTRQNLNSEQLEPRAMFSVSPIEPIVSLDDAPVSQTDYQCASAEVCVIENAAPVNATPVQDVALTSEKITTSSVSNRDAMFGTLGATETLKENSRLAEEFTNASEVGKRTMLLEVLRHYFINGDRTEADRMERENFMERVGEYYGTDPMAFRNLCIPVRTGN